MAIGVLLSPAAAWWIAIGAAGLLSIVALLWLLSRRYVVQRRVPEGAADTALPTRDDRRDLAVAANDFADRLEAWLEARAIEAPSIIEQNALAIMRGSALGELLQVAQNDPERWKAHEQASAHFDKGTRVEYALAWRGEALKLFDQIVEQHVVAPKAREGFERPSDVAALKQIPGLFRRLADRLRVQEADRVLRRLTVDHRVSVMRRRPG